MATKKRKASAADAPSPASDDVEERLPRLPFGEDDERINDEPPRHPALEDQMDRDVESIIGELGSGAKVKIARVSPETGNAAHVGEMRAEDFSLDALADVYGGGSYYLRVFNGKEQIGPRYRQEIDPSIPPKNPRSPRGAFAQPQQSAGQDVLIAIMSESQKASSRMTEMMMTMMTGFSTAMVSMMQARKTDESPLDTAVKLVELTRPAQREPRPFGEIVEVVKLVDELRGEGGGGGDGTNALIGKAIETVGELAKRNPPARPPVRPPSVTPLHIPPDRAAVSPPQPSDSPPTEQLIMRPWVASVFPHLPMLRAVVGTVEPPTVADLIEQRLDDTAWSDLIADITAGMVAGDPITVDKTMAWARGAAETLAIDAVHVPWLAAVAVELLEIANEQVPDDEP